MRMKFALQQAILHLLLVRFSYDDGCTHYKRRNCAIVNILCVKFLNSLQKKVKKTVQMNLLPNIGNFFILLWSAYSFRFIWWLRSRVCHKMCKNFRLLQQVIKSFWSIHFKFILKFGLFFARFLWWFILSFERHFITKNVSINKRPMKTLTTLSKNRSFAPFISEYFFCKFSKKNNIKTNNEKKN